MRKFLLTGLAGLFCSAGSLLAQDITLSADSVQTLLCRKWEVDYAVVDGMNIGRMPGAPEINYEFLKDKTFMMFSNDPKDRTKGTWSYDPKKKLVQLLLNGRKDTQVVSLKEGEFVMLADTRNVFPDAPPIQMVFKIKGK